MVKARDALAPVPMPLRLLGAAFLAALVPAADLAGGTTFTNCITAGRDSVCGTQGYGPSAVTSGLHPAAHAQLVTLCAVAVIGFVAVALNRRTATTRRIARVLTGLLVVALVVSLGEHHPLPAIVLAVALALSVPPVWLPRPALSG